MLLLNATAQFHLCVYVCVWVCVCDHLRAGEEPESAPVTVVLTATAKLLRYTLTHKANELVDWLLLINCSSVVWFYTIPAWIYSIHTWRRGGGEGVGGEVEESEVQVRVKFNKGEGELKNEGIK